MFKFFAILMLVSTLLFPAPILKTITIDGDMSDWQDILQNLEQVSEDDQGTSWPSNDRDYPVQSTGRDMKTFSFTYDANYLYLYSERYASSSNAQYWFFYVDTNFNGIMESGEPILCIKWQGSNGSTSSYLYTYVPSNPSGDPLVDAEGYADGYTLLGSLNYNKYLEALTGGSSSGIEMECRISWSELGVSPGSPLKFHISSSNSTNVPNQVDDNMGGRNGGAGSTGYAELLWIYNGSKTAISNTVIFFHILCNLGNIEDTFDFSYSSSGSFAPISIYYYEDSDNNGFLSPQDTILNDSNNNTLIDSGSLLQESCIRLFAVISIPSNLSNSDSSNITITATSNYNQGVNKTVLDIITVNQNALDSDGDGLTDEEEISIGSNPEDSDTDDDGIPDGSEFAWNSDTDGDGFINVLDPDSDNDGVLDGTESSITNPGAGTDTQAGNFKADLDPSTSTNPLNSDTDQDGASDGCEDINKNGNLDAGETDPLNPADISSCTDSDGDGLTDAEENYFGTYPNDADSDDDGVPDGEEPGWNLDTDGDGIINALDPDSDNDGVYDGTEMGYTQPNPDTNTGAGYWVPDSDPTTTTNPLSSDTDNDGASDGQEDNNHNGQIDQNETDPNNPDTDQDNIPDMLDGLTDTDGDGIINALDLDSDGDGIADITEGISDDDNDGIMNFLDPNESIPNLLRNDITSSLSSYNPEQIFINYPQDPSLDKFGPNGICYGGEGNLLYQNGSEDADDFYAYHITSPYIDPDEYVLSDNSRPLVFYQLDCQNCTIFLTKENGRIKINF